MHVTFGGDDCNDEDVPMQEDGACTYQGGDAVMIRMIVTLMICFNLDIYDYDHDCRILLQQE